MAVHGTRRRDSVSWDHAGLLKLLAGLARDRTGLPVLRCYWYETAPQGQRTAEHDALAEMPGLKLRLINALPGRREGIESQLRRDLVTLAKSGAITDAFIASANEHIAEMVAEVQDLGLRVVILHIASDRGWTIPLPLRQECDDIVEISGVHLRSFVDLIRGAEPVSADQRYAAGAKSATAGALTHQGLPAAALPAPGAVYQLPDNREFRPDGAGYGAYSADGSAVGLPAQSAQPQYLGAPTGNTAPGQRAGEPGASSPGSPAADSGSASSHSPYPGSVGYTGPVQQPPDSGHPGQQNAGQMGAASGYQNGSAAGYQSGPAAGYPTGMVQNGTGLNGTGLNGTGQNGTAPNGARQNGTGLNGAGLNGHGRSGPAQTGTRKNSKPQN